MGGRQHSTFAIPTVAALGVQLASGTNEAGPSSVAGTDVARLAVAYIHSLTPMVRIAVVGGDGGGGGGGGRGGGGA